MAKSDLSKITAFFEDMAKRAEFLHEEALSRPLDAIVKDLGINASVPSESMPLFDTPEEARAFADDPTAKNIADALAKFIVDGGTNG